MPINPVIIVHPSRLFSETLRIVLRNAPFRHVLVAADLDSVPFDAVSETALFIVGGRTHGHTAGLVRNIRRRLPYATIAVIEGTNKPEAVMMALEAGATGYLCEGITSEVLVLALELMLHGETVLPTAAAQSLAAAGEATREKAMNGDGIDVLSQEEIDLSDGQLSARQASILQALINGNPNKVIAKNLQISEATVKLHVKAVLRKIHVKNRTQAAVWAVKNPAVGLKIKKS